METIRVSNRMGLSDDLAATTYPPSQALMYREGQRGSRRAAGPVSPRPPLNASPASDLSIESCVPNLRKVLDAAAWKAPFAGPA